MDPYPTRDSLCLCLLQSLNEEFECLGFCKLTHIKSDKADSSHRFANSPVNFKPIVITAVEESQEQSGSFCNHHLLHNQPAEYISKDKVYCKECPKLEITWNIERAKAIRQKAVEKAKNKQVEKKRLTDYLNELEKSCIDNEKISSTEVETGFSTLLDHIERMKEVKSAEIGLYYTQKKRKLNEQISKTEASRSALNYQISLLSGNIITKEFVNSLEQTIEGDTLFYKAQEEFKSELRQDEEKLNKELEQLYISMVDKLDKFCVLPSSKKSLRNSNSKIPKTVNTRLKFDQLMDFIMIREADFQHIVLSPCRWDLISNLNDSGKLKSIKKVTLNFRDFRLEPDMMKAMCYLFRDLKNVVEVNIDLTSAYFNNAEFMVLMNYNFWSKSQIRSISVNLSRTNDDDLAIFHLLLKKLATMTQLVDLKLDFSGALITDENVVDLMKSVLPQLSVLESVNLNFSGTNMTKKAVEIMLTTLYGGGVKTMNSFTLDIRRTLMTRSYVNMIERKLPSVNEVRYHKILVDDYAWINLEEFFRFE